MSEKLCTLRTKGGGGGKYTETSLWTNPSPSSAFAAQTVTLSDSLSNYKYVAIKYKYAGTNIGVNDPMPVIVPVDKFKTSLKNNSTRHNILVLGVETNGNVGWTRNVFYASDTTIEFDTGYKQNAASSSGDICVPLEILGLNELDHGTMYTSNVEVFPLATVTGGTQPTYTTKGRAVAIWQMWGRTDNVGFGIRTNVNPTTGAINNNEIYMSQSGGKSWTIQSGASFTVTDTTITTTAISSNNRVVALAYTY